MAVCILHDSQHVRCVPLWLQESFTHQRCPASQERIRPPYLQPGKISKPQIWSMVSTECISLSHHHKVKTLNHHKSGTICPSGFSTRWEAQTKSPKCLPVILGETSLPLLLSLLNGVISSARQCAGHFTFAQVGLWGRCPRILQETQHMILVHSLMRPHN